MNAPEGSGPGFTVSVAFAVLSVTPFVQVSVNVVVVVRKPVLIFPPLIGVAFPIPLLMEHEVAPVMPDQ